MKLFKKSTMSLALTAAILGGVAMTQQASAVNIAQDGLGQVLVFPYYTTRGGWSTLFNITNTSDKTIVAKVRWREGRNSREVRDFNIVLSPYDVWTAGTQDLGDRAGMFTTDNSCTFPELPTHPLGTGKDFTNFAYTEIGVQDNRDRGPESMDRTKEGYFEVFEMGVIDDTNLGAEAIELRTNAKHAKVAGNTAMPLDCNKVRDVLRVSDVTDLSLGNLNGQLDNPINALKGRAVLVKGDDGIAAGYDPLVLANFKASGEILPPGRSFPNLADADGIAVVIDDNAATATVVGPLPGIDAVSELIKRSSVINDYNVKGDSQTDWVLTFPTKGFYVDRAYAASNAHAPIAVGQIAPLAPFDAPVNGTAFGDTVATFDNPDAKSCFDINVHMWDREEFDAPDDVPEDEFSPAEPGQESGQNRMCYEANILSFGDSNIFSSGLQKSVFAGNEAGLPGLNGWAEVTFGGPLPVIGLRMEVRNRGDASVNYGIANAHAYKR